MKTRQPILITGSHRSGTTWIGKTIAEHPEVEYIHEPFNIDYPNAEIPININTWFLHANTYANQDKIEAAFNEFLVQGKHTLPSDSWIRNIWPFKRQTPTAQRALIKDPIALLSADWLHQKFVTQNICMIRNPYAFVGSLKTAGWDFEFGNFLKQERLVEGLLAGYKQKIITLSNDTSSYDLVDRAIELWNILHFVILDYQHRYPEWLYVKHESVAMNPHKEFEHIFAYLNLEKSSTINSYIDKFTAGSNPEESNSTQYQPRNATASLDTWRERLDTIDTERITERTKEIGSQYYPEMY